jgi:hypothetical protein
MLGIRRAERKASVTKELPIYAAVTLSRTSPKMRLKKIPAATRKAERPMLWRGLAGAVEPLGMLNWL